MKIATASESRQLDETMISNYGVPQIVLMENAAMAAREVIEWRWGIAGRKIALVCGTGSNGGDGFALARQLHSRGASITVIVSGDCRRIIGAAEINFNIISSTSIEIRYIEAASINPLNPSFFNGFDLIVDAMFGTGLSRNLSGSAAKMVEVINESGIPVLALDIASGINADTGEVMGTAITAEATVCFALPKRGNLLYPGFQFGGQLYCSAISFSNALREKNSIPLSLNIPQSIPARNPAGHKGSFGKILVIGGSSKFCAAPAFAAAAALRTGAGTTQLAVPGVIKPIIASLTPESVYVPMEKTDILACSSHADAAVLGPGLSTEPEAVELARTIISEIDCPLVLDADGLNALAGQEELSRSRNRSTILTPHPGEMARLLGKDIQEIERRRVDSVLEAAEKYNAVVVLKGAHSLIADPSGMVWLNLTGNSGMATAGSGDVLAGIAAALTALADPVEAVKAAVYLHGMAGDIAAETLGEAGIISSDLLNCIPTAIGRFSDSLLKNPYAGKIIPL